uniref:Uncharacterized protein n=1 Tax=Tetranychus urticae TaxID=32264 RepID=T1KKF0_TETUR
MSSPPIGDFQTIESEGTLSTTE